MRAMQHGEGTWMSTDEVWASLWSGALGLRGSPYIQVEYHKTTDWHCTVHCTACTVLAAHASSASNTSVEYTNSTKQPVRCRGAGCRAGALAAKWHTLHVTARSEMCLLKE